MRACLKTLQSSVTVILTAALAWGSSAFAQPTASQLPGLIAEMKARNPMLREARLRWEAAQAKIPLSTGLPAPRIGVEFEEIPRGSIKVNQATIMYQLIQALPFPGKLSAKRRVAVAEAQVAAAAFKQAEWELVTQLEAAYYDLWLLNRQAEIQQAIPTSPATWTTDPTKAADTAGGLSQNAEMSAK